MNNHTLNFFDNISRFQGDRNVMKDWVDRRKAELARELEAVGYPINLDYIHDRQRTFADSHREIFDKFKFLSDLDLISKGLNGSWVTYLDDPQHTEELQRRVEEALISG